MRALRFVVASVIVIGLAGCGSKKDQAMPDVTGKNLDVAKSDIKRAGFGGKAEVLGGGAFGVLKDSNWEVCEQTPAPGKPLTGTPRLKVERDCNRNDAEPSEPSPEPAQTGSDSQESEGSRVLTVENNAELAALLSGPATGKSVDAFSEKYRVQVIQFDGFVADVYINPREHNGESTITVMAGDASASRHTGPAFELGWYGHESPLEKFTKGANVRVTALVGAVYEFDPHQFFLTEAEGVSAFAPR